MHVNPEALDVIADGNSGGGHLVAFTAVTLVRSEEDWAVIAKDGVILGRVETSKLRELR